jgi:hypothetical protein
MGGDRADAMRVVRGDPTDEELAAVVAVLFGAAALRGRERAGGTAAQPAAPGWARAHHLTHRRPGSWKSSPTRP